MSIRIPTLRAAVITVCAAVALSGCAAKTEAPSFGSRLALEGGEVAALGKEWNKAQASAAEGRALIGKGEKQIRKGEKEIASGEANIDDGQAKIVRGKRMVTEGERLAAAAEAKYNARIQSAARRIPATN